MKKIDKMEILKNKTIDLIQSKGCLSYEELARELDISKQRVYYLIKKYDLQIKYDHAKLVLLQDKRKKAKEDRKQKRIEKMEKRIHDDILEKEEIIKVIDNCAESGHLTYALLGKALNQTSQIIERKVDFLGLKEYYALKKAEIKVNNKK